MRFIFTFICLNFTFCVIAQRCVTPEYEKQNSFASSVQTAAPTTESAGRDTIANEVIVVPVVFHILYNSNVQNVSDQQVLSQLAALNNDYRRLNADTINTPAAFRGVAADTRIAFCLAKVDPNGYQTSGIIHKYTKSDLFLSDDEMKFSSSGGDDAWDSKRYLNIWVCNLFGRTLGYAVMPGGPAEKDGVVIQYTSFGTIGTAATPFNKGRTVTHEVGHWLGLRHLWGDAECGDDGIADTPPQEASNSGCPSFPHLSSCSINFNGDMFMNYMDFTNDDCMNMFTQGQKNEMRGQFAVGNARNSFLNTFVCDSSLAQNGPLPTDSTSGNDITISVYPNPFISQITVSSNNEVDLTGKTIKLYDVTGKLFVVQTLKSQKTSINVGNLPPGMYFLKMDGGNTSKVFKLIKQSNSSF